MNGWGLPNPGGIGSVEEAQREAEWGIKQAAASVRKFNQQLEDYDRLVGWTDEALAERLSKGTQ